MSYELIYTSAERGLKSGSRGFATVAMTEGMPAHCMQLCESMSGYVHVFDLNSEQYVINPVAWSHYRVKCGSTWYSLFSRVSAHAKDYTGRTNKIAHHLMLEQPQETFGYANGPSDLMDSSFFESTWQGDARFLAAGRQPESMRSDSDPQAKHWLAAGLSAEVAARMAGALAQDTDAPMVLLFDPQNQQANLTGLIQDLLELLPPERRWKIGFSTYYSMHPSGSEVHLRACAKGTDAARKVARHPRAVVVDIDAGTVKGLEHLPEADATLVQAAQSGSLPAWAQAVKEVVSAPDPVVSPRAADSESKTSLPPLRSDRPGIRSDRPPPPSSRIAEAKVVKKQKSILPVLLGVGVGILILLLFAGQKMISGLSKPDEGDVIVPSVSQPAVTDALVKKSEKIGNEDTIPPAPTPKTVADPTATPKPEPSPISSPTATPIPPPTSGPDIQLNPFVSYEKISNKLSNDLINLNEKGKRKPKSEITTRNSDLGTARTSDDDKKSIIFDKDKKIIYFKKDQIITLNELVLKADRIKLDTVSLIEILSKIKDRLKADFNGEDQGFEFELKDSSLVFPGLGEKIATDIMERINTRRLKMSEPFNLAIDNLLKIKKAEKNKPKLEDFKGDDKEKNFRKKNTEFQNKKNGTIGFLVEAYQGLRDERGCWCGNYRRSGSLSHSF